MLRRSEEKEIGDVHLITPFFSNAIAFKKHIKKKNLKASDESGSRMGSAMDEEREFNIPPTHHGPDGNPLKRCYLY